MDDLWKIIRDMRVEAAEKAANELRASEASPAETAAPETAVDSLEELPPLNS